MNLFNGFMLCASEIFFQLEVLSLQETIERKQSQLIYKKSLEMFVLVLDPDIVIFF